MESFTANSDEIPVKLVPARAGNGIWFASLPDTRFREYFYNCFDDNRSLAGQFRGAVREILPLQAE
jgi:hypothetical protein